MCADLNVTIEEAMRSREGEVESDLVQTIMRTDNATRTLDIHAYCLVAAASALAFASATRILRAARAE